MLILQCSCAASSLTWSNGPRATRTYLNRHKIGLILYDTPEQKFWKLMVLLKRIDVQVQCQMFFAWSGVVRNMLKVVIEWEEQLPPQKKTIFLQKKISHDRPTVNSSSSRDVEQLMFLRWSTVKSAPGSLCLPLMPTTFPELLTTLQFPSLHFDI